MGPSHNEEELKERAEIEELQILFAAFDQLQRAFNTLASPQEIQDAQGRRCILHITGLKHHQTAFFFEVAGSSVRQVEPFTNYTTYIGAPLDSVLRVLKGVLAGDAEAFSKEWSRGQAKLEGEHSIHDGLQFREAFRRLAKLVARYQELVKS